MTSKKSTKRSTNFASGQGLEAKGHKSLMNLLPSRRDNYAYRSLQAWLKDNKSYAF